MKNWNRTGKIKALVLLILFMLNIVNATNAQASWPIFPILGALIFGLLGIPLIAKVNERLVGAIIENPNWNDNPLTLKKPLSFFQFGSYFFIVSGLSIMLGSIIRYMEFNQVGLVPIALGVGILGGIYLTLKMKN